MKQILIMLANEIAVEAAKGIGAGLRGFFKNSVIITGLIIMLCGSGFVNYEMWSINKSDRSEYKAELKEYADALRQANRLVMEAQADRAICLAEQSRQAADIAELRAELRLLKQKR